MAAHEKNEHDSKTLEAALTSANKNRSKPIAEAICDRGYRGKKEVLGTKVCIPGKPFKRDTEYQKEQKRKKFRRRAAIEPVIGHLKSDFRLSRNYLKGFVGDQINLLLAATAWNLKKWMKAFIHAHFYVDAQEKRVFLLLLLLLSELHRQVKMLLWQRLSLSAWR